jgi:UDP-glucose 4-epimerase
MDTMKCLVTGGAGFVGSHIVDALLEKDYEVVVYDNLSTGNLRFLDKNQDKITLIKGDLLDCKKLGKSLQDIDAVFHMAAHADIKKNLTEPLSCITNNTVGTSNLLEAMRQNDVNKILFASTGSVYGEPDIFPTPENAPFPVQTSLYGASKLACEGLLQAYSEGYGFKSYIFRFVSLMGERYSHGCVFDFYKKLQKNQAELEIFGDGKQRKSYLYVKDCVNAMLTVFREAKDNVNIFNLGHDDYIDVTSIAKIVCNELKLKNVKFNYTGGVRGWVGDSPFIHLDISKIKSFGWKPTKTIPECIKTTLQWLRTNQWIFERE